MAANWDGAIGRELRSHWADRARCAVRGTLLALVLCGPAAAADFHVTPDGAADGDGSAERPWSLAAALASPAAVQPGDTLWLAAGTYDGTATCTLRGTAEARIVVRAMPSARVTLDFQGPVDRSRLFVVDGDYVDFRGLEFTCSDTKRVTQLPGSWPEDINRGGIHCRTSHVRFINIVIHDTGGIGFWREGEAGEVYGSLIYHNGWKGPDRGHGHGIYAQNERGVKRFADNVIFNQFGDGLHLYGSEKARLSGFRLEGNVSFNNGALNGGGDRTRNILIGGGTPAERIEVAGNFTYHSGLAGTNAQFGYAAVNEDLLLEDNYFVGLVRVQDWRRALVRRNTFVALYTLAEVYQQPELDLAAFAWDENRYLSGEVMYTPLLVKRGDRTLAADWQQWQASAGFDAHGEYVQQSPQGVDVFVRPNEYEAGRANVIAYNWDKLPAVEADLSGVLRAGQRYRVVRAQDFYGAAVLEGTYDGQPLRLPMTPLPCAPAVGLEELDLPVTGPEFEVFVVLGEE